MRCLSRRIADGQVLSMIKQWLRVPVVERTEDGERRTTEAADKNRGVPQGGPLSPMLANLYFRRFILAWKQFGHERQLQARVVNYADDLVICCRPGKGQEAMEVFRSLMTRLGLTVNERKTRLAKLPEESFDFLGYTIGRFYGNKGRSYIGTKPSKKAVHQIAKADSRGDVQSMELAVAGGANTRDQLDPSRLVRVLQSRPGDPSYRLIRRYTERRFRRWLMRREQRHGTGYKRYPIAYLYETLGLYPIPTRRADMLKAKA